MKVFKGAVAAITGAASGIGRSLAISLANEGCGLALADIDPAGLKQTADMIKDNGNKITTHVLDVADREQVYGFADDVISEHGKVNIIINNAAVGLAETLEDVTYEDFNWLLGINLWGVIYGSKAFLPYLKQQPEGHIVNISSVHGLFTNRNVGPYCTSKFAVRGFSLTLCQELKDTSVRVSCVHPGGIRTNIVRNTRFIKASDPELSHEEVVEYFDNNLARTSADKAAHIIIKGIKKNKTRILVGTDAHIFDILVRLFPGIWQKLMAKL
ncbi:MAG: SDR family oxidoreductase [Deltaproteobacteria bacterium]|jgi:NAD(P)-dependent dehydrogenase (short-subunit alcohol dehydrogenase family)|nr:SDR family oxidoreductase [Deltaproteobacteria bacterium]